MLDDSDVKIDLMVGWSCRQNDPDVRMTLMPQRPWR